MEQGTLTATEQRASGVEISIVIPVFRSEPCLPALIESISQELQHTGWGYEVILVNDFSPDRSWQVIESLCRLHPNIVGVDLRRNFGQDNAILTGLRLARGRYAAIMDDDLQHHPKYLPDMHRVGEQGADVVYADFDHKRQKLWKNAGSWLNGKIANWVLSKPDHLYLSPYKLIRREIVELICQHDGPTPYIDGLIFDATWRVAKVPAEHMPRYAGHGGYRFWRSVGVSARLIFSFSVKPIRMMVWVGIATSIAGLAAAVCVIMYRLLFPEDFPAASAGWASLMVTVLFVSGVQMMCAGILGEYAGRTYLRVNNKLQASVREILNHADEERTSPSAARSAVDGGTSCRQA